MDRGSEERESTDEESMYRVSPRIGALRRWDVMRCRAPVTRRWGRLRNAYKFDACFFCDRAVHPLMRWVSRYPGWKSAICRRCRYIHAHEGVTTQRCYGTEVLLHSCEVTPHCFFPHTELKLYSGDFCLASQLSPGDELASIHAGSSTHHCETMDNILEYIEGALARTCQHLARAFEAHCADGHSQDLTATSGPERILKGRLSQAYVTYIQAFGRQPLSVPHEEILCLKEIPNSFRDSDLISVCSSISAFSAPARGDHCRCLCPHSWLLLKSRIPVDVEDVQSGDELASPTAGGATILAVRQCRQEEYDIVKIAYAMVADPQGLEYMLRVTASHVLDVCRPSATAFSGCHARGKAFSVCHARDIQIGDLIQAPRSDAKVLRVDRSTRLTHVFEIELQDHNARFYATSSRDAPSRAFVEVKGVNAHVRNPERRDYVKVLSWPHHYRFRQILLERPELQDCRDLLARHGFHSDVTRCLSGTGWSRGLGPGKMFVRPDQARDALLDLHRWQRDNRRLRKSDVIVSREYESLVRDLVRNFGPRNEADPAEDMLNTANVPDITAELYPFDPRGDDARSVRSF